MTTRNVPLFFVLVLAAVCNEMGANPVQDQTGQGNQVPRRNDRISRSSSKDWGFLHTWSLPHFPSLSSATSLFHDTDYEDVKVKIRIEALEKSQAEVLSLLRKLTEASKSNPCADKNKVTPAPIMKKPEASTVPEIVAKPVKVTLPVAKPTKVTLPVAKPTKVTLPVAKPVKPTPAASKPASVVSNDEKESSNEASGSKETAKPIAGGEKDDGKDTSTSTENDEMLEKPASTLENGQQQQTQHAAGAAESDESNVESSSAHVEDEGTRDEEKGDEVESGSTNGSVPSANSGQGSSNELAAVEDSGPSTST